MAPEFDLQFHSSAKDNKLVAQAANVTSGKKSIAPQQFTTHLIETKTARLKFTEELKRLEGCDNNDL